MSTNQRPAGVVRTRVRRGRGPALLAFAEIRRNLDLPSAGVGLTSAGLTSLPWFLFGADEGHEVPEAASLGPGRIRACSPGEVDNPERWLSTNGSNENVVAI